MAQVKFKGFDTDAVLREIQADIERDLKKNPAKALDSHKGELIEGNCAKCGRTTIKIMANGKAQCMKCGTVSKVDLKVTYK